MPLDIAELTQEKIVQAEKLQKQRERKRANYRRYFEKRQDIITQESESQTRGVAFEKVEIVS